MSLKLADKYKKGKDLLFTLAKQNDELLWARIWDDTKSGIDWAQDIPSISPGRWAVGYNYLYVITRILEEKVPHKVLDIGLGISSSLFSCYFDYKGYLDSEHIIVEQDKEWASFYKAKHSLSKYSRVILLDCIERSFPNGDVYNAYNGFLDTMKGKKYSLISIDGPWGSDRHSRRDIVDLLPEILDEDWVIVMDDSERPGEKDTIQEIQEVLRRNKIDCCTGFYSGMTECCIITTSKNQFLCSL